VSYSPRTWVRLARPSKGVVALAILLVLIALSSAAVAQEIPLVDATEQSPEEQVLEVTLTLYDEVLAHPGGCDTLWRTVRDVLDREGPGLEAALAQLTERSGTMSPDELTAMALVFREGLFANAEVDAAQSKLFSCLKAVSEQGKSRPLENQMRRFYAYHQALFDVLVGNVD